MAAPRRSTSAGPSTRPIRYAKPAPYDNKPDSPSFLTSEGKPDEAAAEENKNVIEEDNTPILADEEISRLKNLAMGEHAALLAMNRVPEISPAVAKLYEKAYEAMKLYWAEGWTRSLRKEFDTINATISMVNSREGRPESYEDNHFPAHQIIKLFDIYLPLFEEMMQRPDREEMLAKKFLDGNRMFIKGLSQRGIIFRRLVTPDVWKVMEIVLLEWGTQEDLTEMMKNLAMPTYQQREVLEAAGPIVERFFTNLGNKNHRQASKDLQALEAVNGQLRKVNNELAYREEDHTLPLEDFRTLLDGANNEGGIDEDSLVLHGSRVKGKLELMGLEVANIPSQVRRGPEFIEEQREFVQNLLQHPMNSGKGKSRVIESPSITSSSASSSRRLPAPKSPKLLTGAETSQAAAPPLSEAQLMMHPKIQAYIEEQARMLAASMNPPRQIPQQSEEPSANVQRTRSPSPPARRNPAVTDIDPDMDAASENGDISDADEDGTMMIHPGLKNGLTSLGKVMFVRPIGRGAYRVFLNAGTEKKPFIIVRNGADFPRGFAEEWFQDPRLRSESDKPKGWKPESFRSMDFIQTETPAAGARRAPPAYIYGLEGQKPVIWTKTEFIMRCGKSSAMREIQKRLTYRSERQKKMADARSQRVHPDTGAPLTASDRESMPWLFGDGSAIDSAASNKESRFTKIISGDEEDVKEIKPVLPTNNAVFTDPAGRMDSSPPTISPNESGKRESSVPNNADLQDKIDMLAKALSDLQQQLGAIKNT